MLKARFLFPLFFSLPVLNLQVQWNPLQNFPQPPDGIKNHTTEESTLVSLVNSERAKAGVKPLKVNLKLVEAARRHSENMGRTHRFAHTLDGKNVGGRLDKAGYKYRRAGENIARSEEPLAHILRRWMASPGHRRNILNPEFQETGIGIYEMKNGNRYLTQIFAASR